MNQQFKIEIAGSARIVDATCIADIELAKDAMLSEWAAAMPGRTVDAAPAPIVTMLMPRATVTDVTPAGYGPTAAPLHASAGAIVPSAAPPPVDAFAAPPAARETHAAIHGPGRDRDRDEWIDAEAERRIAADVARATAAGFVMGQPVYAAGTVVNSTGVANARKSRAEHDALPTAGAALHALIRRVEAEERSDVSITASDLRMTADGRICSVNESNPDNLLRIERDGLSQLATRIASAIAPGERPASLGAYLESVNPTLRAQNFNAHTAVATGGNGPIVLRTRRDLRTGGRAVFASVSDTYAQHDADETARTVLDAVKRAGLDTGPDALKTRIEYDGRRTLIDLVAHSNVPAESYAAGELFRAGVRIETDDTGGGSLGGGGFVDQNLCRNLIILHHARAAGFSIRHTGDPSKLTTALRVGIRDALASVSVFVEQWSNAVREPIPGLVRQVDQGGRVSDWLAADGASVRAASDRMIAELLAASLAGAVARDLVPIGGGRTAARVKDAVPALLTQWASDASDGSAAFKADPTLRGLTRAAVTNAVTRYAHKRTASAFDGDALERVGGRILAGGANVDRQLAAPTADEWREWGTTPRELVQLARIL